MPESNYGMVKKHFIELIPEIQKELLALSEGNTGFCYSISEFARQMLKRYGIKCQVGFVRGVIENNTCKNLRKVISIESPEFMEALKSNGGYNMGVGIGKDVNGKPNFHAVLYFPDEKEILDMTTKLFHRPPYNIYMPDYFYGGCDEYFDIYSDGFPKDLCRFPEFREVFNPMIDREPKCKELIKRFSKELDERIAGDII